MERLSFQTHQRCEFLDLTQQIQDKVQTLNKKDGAVLVYCPHTTAGLTLNEGADPDVKGDMIAHLERLVPLRADFHHAEGNSDAHLKASLLGSSVLLALQDGKIQLGTWQAIYFAEFDGPRTRQVWVQAL